MIILLFSRNGTRNSLIKYNTNLSSKRINDILDEENQINKKEEEIRKKMDELNEKAKSDFN